MILFRQKNFTIFLHVYFYLILAKVRLNEGRLTGKQKKQNT